jgi:uncharacterized protein DUF4440
LRRQLNGKRFADDELEIMKTMSERDRLIHAREAELRQAQLSGDVVALDRLIDDALIFTTLDGSMVGKADDLDLHRSGRLKITRMEPSDWRILHLGATVIVNVRMTSEGAMDGVSFGGVLRYTRAWQEQRCGWRVVAGHMSLVQS